MSTSIVVRTVVLQRNLNARKSIDLDLASHRTGFT